jgi:hypothetical protein
MPFAPLPDQPQPNRRLRRLLADELATLRPASAASAAACDAERYRKHFDSFAHACLLLFHGLSRGASLRQSYAAFSACPGLVALSGLATAGDALAVSFSQFAASNTSRPAAFLSALLPALLTRLQRSGQTPAIPPDLLVLDATFLHVSLVLANCLPPATHARNKGVRLQCQYQPATALPLQTLLTTTRINDVQALDQLLLDDPGQLAALAGQTLIFDLGYYSHRRFAGLRNAAIHIITRLHPQATRAVTAERPVQACLEPQRPLAPGELRVLADQEITLGSPNNRAGAVLPRMRLVTALVAPSAAAARRGLTPQLYQLVTDRYDLPPRMVVQAYRWRWRVPCGREVFFRWLKSHLHLDHLLGYSANAIELTVALALLVHLLVLLAAQVVGIARGPRLVALLPWALAHLSARDATARACPQQFALPVPP